MGKVYEFTVPVGITIKKKPKKHHDDKWRRAQDIAEEIIDDFEAGKITPVDMTAVGQELKRLREKNEGEEE